MSTGTCYLCKSKQPDSKLNIEGWIHHRTPIACFDKRSCSRRRRKLKRKKGNKNANK